MKLEDLESRIEELIIRRRDKIGIYTENARELFVWKLEYNDYWKNVPKSERPSDLVDNNGAFYKKRWATMGGFGALVR